MRQELRDMLRAEIAQSLMKGDFTPAVCSTVMRMTEAARDLLRAGATKPEDFEKGTEHFGDQISEAAAPSAETFGVKALRELLPILQQKLAPKASTTDLVKALAAAKEAKLDDVVAELQTQLRIQLGLPIAVMRGFDPEPEFGPAPALKTKAERVSDLTARIQELRGLKDMNGAQAYVEVSRQIEEAQQEIDRLESEPEGKVVHVLAAATQNALGA